VTSALRYVFAPAGTSVPTGTVLCPGAAWGEDGSGRRSGFTRDLSHCLQGAASSACIAYPRGPFTLTGWSFDPFAGISQPVGTVLPTPPMLDWSVAVPDGAYRVVVTYGHPSSLTSPTGATTPRHHHVLVAGATVVDEDQLTLGVQSRSVDVDVAGGRLRVCSGGRANGPAIQAVSIARIEANAAPTIAAQAAAMPASLVLP
jgi:hypothetical protein